MKYAIIVKNDDFSYEIASKIRERVIHTYDEENPDLVVAIGGDGTILSAIKKYFNLIDKVVFYGINTGHLGFYTNWKSDEVDDFIESINNGSSETDVFSLLEYKINNEIVGYALNEVTMRNNYFVAEFDVYVDDFLFETFRGSGLCVSTTNGSTAFNKSLGGSIIDTDIEVLQLSEIASVNSNAYRTLGTSAVFSKRRKVVFKESKPSKITITADQDVYEVLFKELSVKISDLKVHFACHKAFSFWHRVNQSFI